MASPKQDFFVMLASTELKNSDFFLITGDLGFNAIEPFMEARPNDFLNCGVAEQSMLGVAAGVASLGKRVFVYSIANFPTFRAAEQIRNDIDYTQLPVTIVAAGAGLSYGALGYSHHAVQDIALMRIFDSFEIFSPTTEAEMKSAVHRIMSKAGPSYLRLPGAYSQSDNYLSQDCTGSGVAFLSFGPISIGKKQIENAAGVDFCCSSSVVSISDHAFEERGELLTTHTRIATYEEHYLDFGFGNTLRGFLEKSHLGSHIRELIQIGLKADSKSLVGDPSWIMSKAIEVRKMAIDMRQND